MLCMQYDVIWTNQGTYVQLYSLYSMYKRHVLNLFIETNMLCFEHIIGSIYYIVQIYIYIYIYIYSDPGVDTEPLK